MEHAFITWIGVASAQVVFIGLRAFQQRNVAFDNYWAVMPTSWSMAIVEVYVISSIATLGWSWWTCSALGVGGSLGALFAMVLHKKLMMKGNDIGTKVQREFKKWFRGSNKEATR